MSLYQAFSHHLAIFLRGHLSTTTLSNQVREQVQSVDPTLPVFGTQTLNETVSTSLSERRFSMQMVGMFALTALLLAAIGVYGVISSMVAARTHEIGIRLALGASKTMILQLVLKQGLWLAIAGATLGLVAAAVASRLMEGLLYGVRPTDPALFAGLALLLIAVALVACYFPARRALRVDPMVALRCE